VYINIIFVLLCLPCMYSYIVDTSVQAYLFYCIDIHRHSVYRRIELYPLFCFIYRLMFVHMYVALPIHMCCSGYTLGDRSRYSSEYVMLDLEYMLPRTAVLCITYVCCMPCDGTWG
jgi:hypothetical protein